MISELLRAPWRQPDYLPKEMPAWQVVSMLSSYERPMLHWLARNFGGDGAIVDLGPFLGGSTVFFAQGVRDRIDGKPIPIHSFDFFRLGPFEKQQWFIKRNRELPPDDNTRGIFEDAIRDYDGMVQIYEGDIKSHGWDKGTIGILFVDLAKTGATNDHVLAEFFPHMIPGSILIQQDYLWSDVPWLQVCMLKLRPCFKRLVSEPCSVVYECTRVPTASELRQASWAATPHAERMVLMDEAIAMETDEAIRQRLISTRDSNLMIR